MAPSLGDGAAVRAELASVIPEARAGVLDVLACEASRLRLKGEHWAGHYAVTVRRGEDPGPQVIRLSGTTAAPGEDGPEPSTPHVAFGDPAWHARLPVLGLTLRTEPPDAGLPALPVLTHPERARDLLERSIRGAGPGYDGFRLVGCAPRVVRYKPGSRCTVLYHLDYPPELTGHSWPEVVVAKTYHGDKGRVAWSGMRALWESPMASSDVAIAEPLAFLDELKVLVQGPIREETTLKELIRRSLAEWTPESRAELSRAIRRTAAGLAALHGCGVLHGELVTWEDELAEVREMVDRVAVRVPTLAGAAEPTLRRLAELAAVEPAQPARPAHRSFRPDQVLLGGGEVGFIDFDGFCQAEPALDIALFRSSAKELGWSPAHTDILAGITDEFVAEYDRHGLVSRQRVALWETLDLFTRILRCWIKVKPEKLPAAKAALETELAALALPMPG
ncbi:MAG: phosphotransferase family protein [Actinomycetes bacterium]